MLPRWRTLRLRPAKPNEQDMLPQFDVGEARANHPIAFTCLALPHRQRTRGGAGPGLGLGVALISCSTGSILDDAARPV